MGTSTQRQARVISVVIVVGTVAAFVTLDSGQALAANVVCGQRITQDTVVGNDLVDCPGHGLVIGKNGVTLDLAGHIIDGVTAASSAGIDNSGGFDGIEIVNGTVQQFNHGVYLVGAAGNRIEGLTSLQTFDGIMLVDSTDNQIESSRVWDNFHGIILKNSDGNSIQRNVAFSNQAVGIVLLVGSDNNRVELNRCFDNEGWGFSGSEGDRNTFVGNASFSNGNVGIEQFTSTNVVISHNDVFDNARGIVFFDTDGSSVRGNRVWSNVEDGIQVRDGSTGDVVRHNRSRENGDDGIHIFDAGNTVARNRTNMNGDLGIFAVAGTIDGGGNRAHRNGNPLQCVGVSCD